MSWFEFDQHRIWYERHGSGDPILFLHHGEADHRLWDPQVEHFATRYDVVVPDLLGFGKSDKPDLDYTLQLYTRFVEKLVDELNLTPVTLVGACVGSAAGLQYAYEHPENVSALILVNTLTADGISAGVLGPATRFTNRFPIARGTLSWLVRRGWIPRTRREAPMRAAFGDKVDERWLRYFSDQRWHDRRSIRAWISMGKYTATFTGPRSDKPDGFPPTCSVWGTANRILPLASARDFNATLRPDEVHELVGAGHMAPLERPEELNAIIESFLRRHARRGAMTAI